MEGNRFPVGEPDGSNSERANIIAELLTRAGFKSFVLSDIRSELWLKAWGAVAFNPVSALTGSTMHEIIKFPLTRTLVVDMMTEAQLIAERLGIHFRVTMEARLAGAGAVGPHKTSMLQDAEAGRPLEVDAIIGSVSALGRLTGTPCPSIDAVYACTDLLSNRQRACMPTSKKI